MWKYIMLMLGTDGLSEAAQSLYVHILGFIYENKLQIGKSFHLKDKALIRMTGFSRMKIYRAKRELAAKGVLKVIAYSRKDGTKYMLPRLM